MELTEIYCTSKTSNKWEKDGDIFFEGNSNKPLEHAQEISPNPKMKGIRS